jgi:hypothetical protein
MARTPWTARRSSASILAKLGVIVWKVAERDGEESSDESKIERYHPEVTTLSNEDI